MSCDGGFGNLNFLRVWHDNSAPGVSASWFLDKVIIEDIAARKRCDLDTKPCTFLYLKLFEGQICKWNSHYVVSFTGTSLCVDVGWRLMKMMVR